MDGRESFSLREVAEMLGISKRSLQRRIQEGAFPGRFLAPGRHGLETRIPSSELRGVIEDAERHGVSLIPQMRPVAPTAMPAVQQPGALATLDAETLRTVVVDAVRSEQELLLSAVRRAFHERDTEIRELRQTLEDIQNRLVDVQNRLRTQPASSPTSLSWLEGRSVPVQSVDVDQVLNELDAIESMLTDWEEN